MNKNISHRRYLLTVLLLSLPPYTEVVAETCKLYAVHDQGLNDSRLFTISMDTFEINPFGELHKASDIEALDFNLETSTLYAASGDNTERPGYLYIIDEKGNLNEIGSTGFSEIEALSFRPRDGTLWAWAKGDGLIKINPQTLESEIIIPSEVKVEGLTWNEEGTQLYAAQDANLWVYDGERVEKVCELPGHVEALEIFSKNTLLLGIHGRGALGTLLHFQILDLETCNIVMGADISTENYNDIEGITWSNCSDENNINTLIEEVALQEPAPELFEFIGQVSILTEDEFQFLNSQRQQQQDNLTRSEYEYLAYEEEIERENDDSMILASADGRMYRERIGAIQNFPPEITSTMIGHGNPTDIETSNDDTQNSSGLSPSRISNEERGIRKIIGGDGRQLITSSSYPWRAVGVSLRLPNNFDRSVCSASMIAPRVALTSAHCVSPDGNTLRTRRVAPGARGTSYNGNKYPFGIRFVEWYVWPSKWKGQSTARYDYALLILRDINWSPGWVLVGSRSNISYRKFNTAGYPGNNYSCADAPASADGKCDGFMYRQYEDIRSAGYGYFFHEFDTNRGQSGSPIYIYNSNSGSRKVFGINEGSLGSYNTATRINKQSFGLICKVINGHFKYKINGETRDARSSYFSNPSC